MKHLPAQALRRDRLHARPPGRQEPVALAPGLEDGMNALAWFWFGAFVIAALLLACVLVGGFEIREKQRRRIEQLEAAGHPLQLVKGGRP